MTSSGNVAVLLNCIKSLREIVFHTNSTAARVRCVCLHDFLWDGCPCQVLADLSFHAFLPPGQQTCTHPNAPATPLYRLLASLDKRLPAFISVWQSVRASGNRRIHVVSVIQVHSIATKSKCMPRPLDHVNRDILLLQKGHSLRQRGVTVDTVAHGSLNIAEIV